MNGAFRITDAAQVPVIINDIRVMSQLSQRAFAAEIGGYQGQMSSWLSGRTAPDTASLIRLANALGYDLALIPREDS